MNTQRPLHIAVLGMGGIGSAVAFQLARAGGHKVTAIARPGSLRFQQLEASKGIVNAKGERADVEVLDRLDEQTPYDVVIVTLQAHRLAAVLPALTQSAAQRILFMFNNFDPEQLQTALGAERCSFGMPFLQAVVDPAGLLHATIGAGGQRSKIDNQPLADLFNKAGLPAVVESQMRLWLRCHVPLCIAFESISIAGVRRGGGASWREAINTARGMKDCFAVIRGLGYDIYPPGKARLSASPAWVAAAMLWTLSRVKSFRELLATGGSECRALIDVLMAAAPRSNPPVGSQRIQAMKPGDSNPLS